MKAVVFRGAGEVAVEDRPEPEIEQPGDAIVRVSMSTICGTDIRVLLGKIPAGRGSTIGHEFTGTVAAAGASVRRFKGGERVVSPFSVFCGGCFYCKKGLLTACERRQVFGFGGLGGAQAGYVRVPEADAVLEALPDAVSDTQAAFLSDVLPGTFAGLQLAGLQAGDTVAVLGCGPTGLCTQLLALAGGAARVIGVDHHRDRLAAAERLGSIAVNFESEDVAARVRDLSGSRGADIAAEATGTATALAQAAALVRPWGAVLNLGAPMERTVDAFPLGAYTGRHVRLVPASVPPVKNYMAPLIKMLTHGVIDPSPIASHTLSLSEAARGYRLMAEKAEGALKVLLKP